MSPSQFAELCAHGPDPTLNDSATCKAALAKYAAA